MNISRLELKYFINYNEFAFLKNKLKVIMKNDENTTLKWWYRISSLYFDSYDDECYFDKLSWIKYREKYRLRFYNNDPSLIKFEIKIKNKDYVKKESFIIDFDNAKKMVDGDYSFFLTQWDEKLKKLYLKFKTKLYKPKVIVNYDREPYILEYNNTRITFDKNLYWSPDVNNFFNQEDITTFPCIVKWIVILEVKYNNFLPDYIKNSLAMTSFKRSAISKYVICREPFYLQTKIV